VGSSGGGGVVGVGAEREEGIYVYTYVYLGEVSWRGCVSIIKCRRFTRRVVLLHSHRYYNERNICRRTSLNTHTRIYTYISRIYFNNIISPYVYIHICKHESVYGERTVAEPIYNCATTAADRIWSYTSRVSSHVYTYK